MSKPNSLSIEQLRFRERETRMEMAFLRQAITAERVRSALDCGVDARERELQTENSFLKQLICEQTVCHLETIPIGHSEPPSASTASSATSDADWYYREYSRRLLLAKERNLVKERKRNGRPGRRSLIREWLELYRESGCTANLRELVGAVKSFEKGDGR